MLFILFVVIIKKYGEESNYETPNYIIFFIFLPLPLSCVQIFPSVRCKQTPSMCMRFEVLTPVFLNLQLFWDVTTG